ncbi:MAG: tRNA (adenosine(37)-N6)-dimethylallyltransferase MiaA [Pseudomonadota bacterium]
MDDRSKELLEDALKDAKCVRPDVVLLAGPTASGKSALAMRLARKLGGEVVNADSMQVYSDLQILSARPTVAEMDGIPHHLFGHVSGADQYDTARWLAETTQLIENRKSPLVLVGGTGLYFSALERGLSVFPTVPPDVRQMVRTRFDELGSDALHAMLDPISAARIQPTDSQRVQRALEVLEATGRSMFDQPQPASDTLPLHGLNVHRIILEPRRDVLHTRIAERFDLMVDMGGLDEVRALLAADFPADRTVLKAIGVPEFTAHLRGEQSFEQAIADAKTATRRYAKRQSTWFRNQMDGEWQRILTADEATLAQ